MSGNEPVTTPALAPGPSLAGRVAVAIAMTVGFYALALGVAALLVGFPVWAFLTDGVPMNIWLAIFMIATAIAILRSIAPRRRRFEAPGVRVTENEQPRLVAAVSSVAGAAGERMPDEIYLDLDVNAAVTEYGGIFGRGAKRVLILGLPLLELLTVPQMRSVVAHEFGHYAGGDTRYGPWTYRTREAIERTVAELRGDERWSRRAIGLPFLWYGLGFLRVTNAISRRQEFAADALAVQVAGREAHVATLRLIHAYGSLFGAYWSDEVLPALNSGLRPPISEGFARFRSAEPMSAAADGQLEAALGEEKSGPYDSHPTLAQRLAFVEALPAGAAAGEGEPAIALVEAVDALERELLAHLAGEEVAAELEHMPWAEAGQRVWLAGHRRSLEEHRGVLGETTLYGAGTFMSSVEEIGSRLEGEYSDLEEGEGAALAAHALRAGVAVAVEGQGFSVSTGPGLPLAFERGAARFEPFAALAEVHDGSLSPDDWRDRCRELGLEDLPLAAKSSSTSPPESAREASPAA